MPQIPVTLSAGDLNVLVRNQAFLNLPSMQKYARLLQKPTSGCKQCWAKERVRSLYPTLLLELASMAKSRECSKLYQVLLQQYNVPTGSVFRVVTATSTVIFNDKGSV